MAVETTPEKIRKQQFKALADDGLLIFNELEATNQTNTMYTVPTGKVFYLTALSLAASVNVDVNTTVVVLFSDDIAFRLTVNEAAPVGERAKVNATSLSFPIPIKFIADDTIKVKSFQVGVLATASMFGYEFDA